MAIYKETTVFNGPIEAFGTTTNCKIVRQTDEKKIRFRVVISASKYHQATQYIFTNEDGLWVADGSINVGLYICLATILDSCKIDE